MAGQHIWLFFDSFNKIKCLLGGYGSLSLEFVGGACISFFGTWGWNPLILYIFYYFFILIDK